MSPLTTECFPENNAINLLVEDWVGDKNVKSYLCFYSPITSKSDLYVDKELIEKDPYKFYYYFFFILVILKYPVLLEVRNILFPCILKSQHKRELKFQVIF